MCDFFWQRLECTADQGDLADIVRASGGGGGGSSSSTAAAPGASPGSSSSTVVGIDLPKTGMDSWQQQLHLDQPASASAFPPLPVDDFGGLLHDLAGTGGGGFFEGPTDGGGGGGGTDIPAVMKTRPSCSNLFSRVLQISPNNSKPLPPPPPPLPLPRPPMAAGHSMQISSPCTPGTKRRKSQAKKVVCIPAPAAASNRPSGEVVPSDLWAWRKYGQKPIKGSPYPRGYYRCSSSKGCSARKQVERSRTDPNMLVITYTSEHNHPWPTQRNALAGSTRSQPTKNSNNNNNNNNNGASSSASKTQRMASSIIKEEPNESTTSSSLAIVKEESDTEKAVAVDRMLYDFEPAAAAMDHGTSTSTDDFFSDLAELDPDPMSLIFARTDRGQEEKNKSKSFIDIFDDWGGSSFGDHQAKKGL